MKKIKQISQLLENSKGNDTDYLYSKWLTYVEFSLLISIISAWKQIAFCHQKKNVFFLVASKLLFEIMFSFCLCQYLKLIRNFNPNHSNTHSFFVVFSLCFRLIIKLFYDKNLCSLL